MKRLALALVIALAGCAGLTPPIKPSDNPLQVERLSGRLSVNVAGSNNSRATGGSASFELLGSPEAGRLELTAPLGGLVARATWQPGLVLLETPQEQRRFATLDDLTREMLGEAVPVPALFDWLQGRPWPAQSHRHLPDGFEQLGWRIDTSRRADGLLVATRLAEPVVILRARLEEAHEGTP